MKYMRVSVVSNNGIGDLFKFIATDMYDAIDVESLNLRGDSFKLTNNNNNFECNNNVTNRHNNYNGNGERNRNKNYNCCN